MEVHRATLQGGVSHTIADSICEQTSVSSGGQKLAAVLGEHQVGEARSSALNPPDGLQGAAMKQQDAGLHVT